MADPFDDLSDDALQIFLEGEATKRNQELVIEQQDGSWIAELRSESSLGGEKVPMADGKGAWILPDTVVVSSSGPSPDRHAALQRLAQTLSI